VEGQSLTNGLFICEIHTYEKVEEGELVDVEGQSLKNGLFICEIHTYL
jgi:hypothetical protein